MVSTVPSCAVGPVVAVGGGHISQREHRLKYTRSGGARAGAAAFIPGQQWLLDVLYYATWAAAAVHVCDQW